MAINHTTSPHLIYRFLPLLLVALGFAPGAVRGQVMLNTVRVSRATPCETESDDALRIAALWTEARAILAAADSSAGELRGQTFVRFVREIDPGNGSILAESTHAFDRRDTPRPFFRSLPGDSLSALGYWRRVNDRTTVFYGPDANALLSEEFVADHCFRIAAKAARSGSLGLAFEPIRQRQRSYSPPEIRGTIWFDSLRQELRSLEFAWITLPGRATTKDLGGEVHFARLADGPWYVPRWHLRMPQDIIESQGSGDNVIRVQRVGIVEEGGVVLSDSTLSMEGRAVVVGFVRDANRRPLAGATVRILGTEKNATTDSTGRFRLEAVPAGLRTFVADHQTIASFGIRVGATRVLLDDGVTRAVSFRAPSTADLIVTLCGKREPSRDRNALRLTLIDGATAAPIGHLRVRLVIEGRSTRPSYSVASETDPDGAVVFCDVPAGQRVVVTTDGEQVPLALFSLGRGEALARTVRTVRR